MISGVSFATVEKVVELYISCIKEILKTNTVLLEEIREEGGIGKLMGTRSLWMRMKDGITLAIKIS